MSKIRLYIDKIFYKSSPITLDKEKSHYLKNVMRKKQDEEINIFNQNEEWVAKLTFEDGMKLLPKNLIRKSQFNDDIWMCFSLIKSKKMNYLIEKVSEIGVRKIVPIVSTFSERFTPNYSRLKKIALEAVEQSEGMSIPIIEEKKNLNEILEDWDPDRKIIFCDEKGNGKEIMKVTLTKKKLAIFIGPVGGWSEQDRQCFECLDHINVSLGSNVLKVDTASLVSLFVLRNLII
tara:strand:+ start:52 stop:750 length:699 start_codon:yes stop_codon:yes gene_type:complete